MHSRGMISRLSKLVADRIGQSFRRRTESDRTSVVSPPEHHLRRDRRVWAIVGVIQSRRGLLRRDERGTAGRIPGHEFEEVPAVAGFPPALSDSRDAHHLKRPPQKGGLRARLPAPQFSAAPL